MTATRRLRELLEQPLPATIPLVMDPLSAKLAEENGFQALYLGGGALGYITGATESRLCLSEICHVASSIRSVTDLPVILDGQCGWGDAMHVDRTIRMVEAAGAAAIEIEDQLQPKRAHHHVGIEHVIPIEQMVEKIRAAVSARRDPDFMIIARTDALPARAGLDEAIRRAEAYRAAGADMLLVLLNKADLARSVGERLDAPLMYMMLGEIETIGMSPKELGALGYRCVVDAFTPFIARHQAMREAYAAIARREPPPGFAGAYKEEVEHVHRTIGLERLLDIERRSVEN